MRFRRSRPVLVRQTASRLTRSRAAPVLRSSSTPRVVCFPLRAVPLYQQVLLQVRVPMQVPRSPPPLRPSRPPWVSRRPLCSRRREARDPRVAPASGSSWRLALPRRWAEPPAAAMPSSVRSGPDRLRSHQHSFSRWPQPAPGQGAYSRGPAPLLRKGVSPPSPSLPSVPVGAPRQARRSRSPAAPLPVPVRPPASSRLFSALRCARATRGVQRRARLAAACRSSVGSEGRSTLVLRLPSARPSRPSCRPWEEVPGRLPNHRPWRALHPPWCRQRPWFHPRIAVLSLRRPPAIGFQRLRSSHRAASCLSVTASTRSHPGSTAKPARRSNAAGSGEPPPRAPTAQPR